LRYSTQNICFQQVAGLEYREDVAKILRRKDLEAKYCGIIAAVGRCWVGWYVPRACGNFPLLGILSKGCSSHKKRFGLCKTEREPFAGICGTLAGAGESGMSPEVSDLLKRALTLSADERAALANTLLDSLETTDQSAQDQSVQEAWDAEVARRMEDLKAGKAVTVPWEQLHRELLALVNEP
jgi:putative addiction module component (TIGR02574 family)